MQGMGNFKIIDVHQAKMINYSKNGKQKLRNQSNRLLSKWMHEYLVRLNLTSCTVHIILRSNNKLLLLLLLFTATEFSLGGSSPYTSPDKTYKKKYT
jgi:hypothetical protein